MAKTAQAFTGLSEAFARRKADGPIKGVAGGGGGGGLGGGGGDLSANWSFTFRGFQGWEVSLNISGFRWVESRNPTT